jgi:prepilin-type N-terminal cleavage/methylation domain-containing protein
MTQAISRRRRTGFTLPELLVSITVLGLVLGTSSVTLLKVQQQYTAQRATTEARETLRAVELLVTRVLRTARANPRNIAPASKVAMVLDPLGRAKIMDNIEVRADFNPVDSALTGDWEDVHIELTADTVFVRWTQGGALEPMAYPVTALQFDFYALDGTPLTDPVAAAATARRVQVTIGVPVPNSTTVLWSDLWISLRN